MPTFINVLIFFNAIGVGIRPGQGFWVYGIPGHFNSGIWYFLVKFGYKVFSFS